MAFNNEIRVLNTSDTNHADNFNEPMRQLLENTQFNAKQIGVLPTLKTTNKESLVGAINENVDGVKCLSNDRGYLNSKLIPITTDIDTVIENGVYTWEYGDNSKKPAGGGSYFVRVQKIVETYVLQEVTMGWGEGKTYRRVMDNGKWGIWKLVATTDKIDILWGGNAGSGDVTLAQPVTNYNKIVMRIDEAGVCSQELEILPLEYPNKFSNSSSNVYCVNCHNGKILFRFKTPTIISINSNTSGGVILNILGVIGGN